MLIFGHKLHCDKDFFWLGESEAKNLELEKKGCVFKKEKLNPNSKSEKKDIELGKILFKKGINCFFYDEKLIELARCNKAEFAILARNEDEIFLANHFGASFILFKDENLAHFGAKVAEFYLFDSKILLLLNEFKNLTKAFKLGVDGVILKNFIQK